MPLVLPMVRIAKKIDFQKLEDLKIKIDDESYLRDAIQAIAQQLTKNLLNKE